MILIFCAISSAALATGWENGPSNGEPFGNQGQTVRTLASRTGQKRKDAEDKGK